MRLVKILGPVGAAVAVKAIWHNVPSFSTRFITQSPSVSTTQAVSWVKLQQTSPVEKSEGWKVVSENPVSTVDTSCGVTTVVVNDTPTITSYCGVTTVHVDNPQATATTNANTTRPDDYVVAQRLAHAANLYWANFKLLYLCLSFLFVQLRHVDNSVYRIILLCNRTNAFLKPCYCFETA